ncbi:PA2169 family four-helix-bundle protein [Hymenobacter sp. 5516J-16]|uniref:PA2169 family four-helix-bundle protein n=1 Tax=Hymenobacter sublimis TaxID=2933777 RepID=A0ABY4J4H3_9BACT|nr:MULTISPECIES: PA2169 family four-helix-bundle protein [Hymenobacter]UOQ77754.1 PA2169 family four-helix-bundle protein [Hymenobacter sp. 5516J-16]UPL47737.1 PA2169 family four-helix-bundle protein [Hymenobacter sublimis]
MNQPQTNSAAGSDTNSNGSLLDQAQQLIGKDNLGGLLNQLGPSLKKASSSIGKLSTTQKVVGGALILIGAAVLTNRSKKGAASEGDETSTLRELLYFVNDRIEGYQRAVDESQDAQQRGYYKQLVSQSQRFANQLNDHLRELGGGRETSTTLKGKLYRRWMDAKAALTGADEKAILGSNIYGEEWALKAYEDALSSQTLTGSLRLEVERQYAQSQKTYEELKKRQAQQ